jgi:3-phenylpropionate/trans-cinnamate dioxygenase ferredoxin reductase subunit
VRTPETTAGDRIDCDLVIIGVGIEPNTAIAAQAGLEISDGIAVDADCRTSVAGVFAAGDCASHWHPWIGRRARLESVQSAIEQGKAAAGSISGLAHTFTAVPWFWSDQYDLKLQIAGLAAGYDETVTRGDRDGTSFSVFYLQSGRVIAVDCINDPRVFMTARKHLDNKPRWPAAAIADTGTDLNSLGDDP